MLRARVVDRTADAIDPAEAERLVDRLRPRDAWPARALLVKADEELGRFLVVLLEPLAEVGRCAEEGGFHAAKI
jgi:hypothetical protein